MLPVQNCNPGIAWARLDLQPPMLIGQQDTLITTFNTVSQHWPVINNSCMISLFPTMPFQNHPIANPYIKHKSWPPFYFIINSLITTAALMMRLTLNQINFLKVRRFWKGYVSFHTTTRIHWMSAVGAVYNIHYSTHYSIRKIRPVPVWSYVVAT